MLCQPEHPPDAAGHQPRIARLAALAFASTRGELPQSQTRPWSGDPGDSREMKAPELDRYLSRRSLPWPWQLFARCKAIGGIVPATLQGLPPPKSLRHCGFLVHGLRQSPSGETLNPPRLQVRSELECPNYAMRPSIRHSLAVRHRGAQQK